MSIIHLLPTLTLVSLLAGCAFWTQEGTRYGSYAGQYRMGTNVDAIIRPEGGRLMAKVTGQDYFEMFPRGNDSFAFKVVDARVTFTRSDAGKVNGFDLQQAGKDFHFNRTSKTVPDDLSKRIDAGSYRVRLIVQGRGSPTVIFEAGLGESLNGWEHVFPAVAGFCRVVAYDRSGLGLSERAKTSRTAEHVAGDLHRALRNAHVTPPFVLVGNSAGGLYSRVFAHLYPDEVAGMVLVEPSSEEYEEWLHQKHPEAFQGVAAELEGATDGFRDHVAAWEASLEQARAAWPLPRVPVVVLTGMRHEPAEAEKRKMWMTMHRRFVDRVPGARQFVSEHSGHGLANTEPELVVSAVCEVVEQIRRAKR
jgi:pimeloyl-ACP methyl ester carboxylesterase